MPWGYLEDSGIMDKWAEKYGIDVEIVQINDYVESINQYAAGAFDGPRPPTWTRCRSRRAAAWTPPR